MKLAANDQADGRAVIGVVGRDIAHGDGAADARAETARGDDADLPATGIGDNCAFARWRAAFRCRPPSSSR